MPKRQPPDPPNLNTITIGGGKPNTTGTVDLDGLFSGELMASGSFDLRRFRLSSVAKLLEVIPIPIILLNTRGGIVFTNQAAGKLTQTAEATDTMVVNFPDLFQTETEKENARSLLEKVLKVRMPLKAPWRVNQDSERWQGRMHLRSVRINKERMVIVIIERTSDSNAYSKK